MQTEANLDKFVQRRLPWLIAGVMLLVYLVTLSRGLTLDSAPHHARALGWDSSGALFAPLHYFLTYPLRWLPGAWQVVGLNVFCAVASALTIALLARSVAILPHDRTRDQRQLEQSESSLLSLRTSWVPPVLAALVCGLQMTFWENAIVASSEALDLLLFAWIIRELLEYRLDRRVSRLYRWAFIYGLSIPNNFGMIGFLPAFAFALIWIRGKDFFNVPFLLRMAALGFAGLLLYLAQPLVQMLAGSQETFWQLLRFNLGTQKIALLGFPRFLLVLIGLTSLFPIFFIGIKWPAQFGDTSPVGAALTNLMTHVIHAVFLLACLYVAFDPAFSPRKLAEGSGHSLLSFYYLGALSIGYFTGYFLLVFAPGTTSKAWQRKPNVLRAGFNYAIRGLVIAAVAAVPGALVFQNLPQLKVKASQQFAQFGKLAAQSLPPQGAVVLSDDPARLHSLAAALTERGQHKSFLLVSTPSLSQPEYHRTMRQRHGQRWPVVPLPTTPNTPLDGGNVLEVLTRLSQAGEMYYLHPSFGYYFERFYLKPQNLVYRMHTYASNEVTAPVCSATELKENDAFWQSIKAGPIASAVQDRKRDEEKPKARKKQQQRLQVMPLIYSRGATYLGVEYQRAGNLEKAAEYFSLALDINPDNPAAYINNDFNAHLKSGKKDIPNPSEGAIKRLAPYGGNWDTILSFNGPIDEPNSCFLLAQRLANARQYRQAVNLLTRTVEFAPELLAARLALGGALVRAGFADKALESVEATRTFMSGKQVATAERLLLVETEALAYSAQENLAAAEKVLLEAQEKHPLRPGPFTTLADIYRSRRMLTNALDVLDRQIKNQPEDYGALINYGAMLMGMGRFEESIVYFDRVLALKPQQPYALMNRAIAQLQCGRLDGAQQDYEQLDRLLPKKSHAVYYGLGEIASKKKNNKTAIRYFTQYLEVAPVGTPESAAIRERIKTLKNSPM